MLGARGSAGPRGSYVRSPWSPTALVLGGGGERILLHAGAETLPKKHHLLLRFSDDTYLMSARRAGAVQCLPREISAPARSSASGGSPLDRRSGPAYWEGCSPAWSRATRGRSVPAHQPARRLGPGNGYLQDLYHAGLHPRRRAVDLTPPSAFCTTPPCASARPRRSAGANLRYLYNRPGIPEGAR